MQVILGTSASTNTNAYKVKEFLLVAEAVKNVERAGGPRKILEDPRYQTLPSYMKDLLNGLINIQEEHQSTNKDKIEPRFLGRLLSMGVVSLYNAVSNMFSPQEATTVDPEMAF